jgi:hypothetical protein
MLSMQRSRHIASSAEKSFGLVDGHNAAGRADQFGKIQRSVAGTTPDIQHRLAWADPGRLPGGNRTLPPRAMLHAEALDLLIVRAQHVIIAGCLAARDLAATPSTNSR